MGTTLESKFDERIALFQEARESLPVLQEEIRDLEYQLSCLSTMTEATQHFEVNRKLQDARAREKTISTGDDEVEYLLNVMPFVKEYMSTTTTSSEQPHRKKSMQGMDGFVEIKHTSNKNLVLQRYLVEVEKNIESAIVTMEPNATVYQECPECHEGMVFNSHESFMVCPKCGIATNHMEMSEHNLTYDQEISLNVVNYFAYKRLNHFIEWLNSLQAKENTEIPDEVLNAVKAEFKKARTTIRGDIKPSKVREYLKKLKYNKFYEHCHHICNALNGVPAPNLPNALEERLKHMFAEIQAPFEKHCPSTRKNFLSYSYVLYKFCELLGEDQYLQYFPLLKSSEKLYQQDQIWKNICRELDWEFIKSI